MRVIRGIAFDDDVADAVERLTDRFVGLMGERLCYRSAKANWILFAMQPPAEGVASGIILRIGPNRKGALLRRAAPPKTGLRELSISADTLEQAFVEGRRWFEEMQVKWVQPKSTRLRKVLTKNQVAVGC